LNTRAIQAVRTPCDPVKFQRLGWRHLSFKSDGVFLRMILPSGRAIAYPFPQLQTDARNKPVVVFMDNAAGKWTECRFGQGAYGGLWMENAVQATARDLFAAAMSRLEAAGYEIVLHVHDEIVAEVPEEFGSTDEFLRILTTPPEWATDLPIAAKVRQGPRFCKSKVKPTEPPPFDPDPEPIHAREEPDPEPEPEPEEPAVEEPKTNNTLQQLAEERRHEHRRHSSDGHVHGDEGLKQGRTIGQWIYQDPPDRPNYLRVDKHITRDGERKFYQHHWNGTSWIQGVKGTYAERKIPYRLPELKAALQTNPDVEVQICEGEKDCNTMARLGFVSTTNPGGALSWTDDLTAWLRVLGVRRSVIHEDNDGKGRLRTAKLISALSGFIKLRVVRYPDVPEGQDVSYWLDEQGHTEEELRQRIKAAEPATPPLPFINMSRWDQEQAPPREWIVHDRIPRYHATLFSGEGAAGKSTIQLQLSFAIVFGREWLATIPDPGPVIFFDAEDDPDEMHRRGDAILEHYGATWSDAIKGGLHLMSFAGQDAVLAAVNRTGRIEPTAIYKRLLEAAGDIKPRMIGIASAANVFAGNENDRSQVQQFIGLLTRLGMLSRGGVQLISHPSLTGINTDTGLSGNTQWHNAVRARFWLKGVKPIDGEQPDSDLREIVFKKNNYGPITDSIVLRWQDGLFLPVAGVASLDQAAREETAREVFLALLKRFCAQNRNVSHKPSVSYAPALFAREEEARSAGLGSKNLEAAMRQLFKDGRIWNEPYGKPSRPSYRISAK
jgi:RecA-family ATPase